MIPPPKRHQVRYHGAYAPNSRLQQAVKRLTVLAERALLKRERERRRVYWVLWAELLKRTFRVDVTRCPQCQGSMQVIAQLYMPEGIKALMPYDREARGPPSWGGG